MDRVIIGGIFDVGGGATELVLRAANGAGLPTGEFYEKPTEDGKVERVERLVNARTATVDSFLAAYTRERDADEAQEAADALRAISERLDALEANS